MSYIVRERLDLILSLYPNRQIKELPSTNRLIMYAIDWAVNMEGYIPTVDTAPFCHTVVEINNQVNKKVCANRPRRQAAISLVHNATLAVGEETRAQRKRREKLNAARRALLAAKEQDTVNEARLAALNEEANSQLECPPTSIEEW